MRAETPTEAYLVLSRTSKMKIFAKMVNGFKLFSQKNKFIILEKHL